jgi:hypothetical protein
MNVKVQELAKEADLNLYPEEGILIVVTYRDHHEDLKPKVKFYYMNECS